MAVKKFRVVKPEVRVLGVDDGVFVPHTKGSALIVGVVFRGGLWLDGVMHTHVAVDGFDATRKIAAMVRGSPHYKQLRVIMLNGVTVAGFNVVDIKRLNVRTGLPVLAVTREKPNFREIHEALKNLPRCEERWKLMSNAGGLVEVSTRSKRDRVFVQVAGILEDDAVRVLRLTSTRSGLPEPLRVAHLVASGVSDV